MKNFITKANLSGGDDSGTATKWGAKESNSVTDELKLAVTATGQSLTAGTGNDPSPDLLAKALTIAAQTAHSYQDSGAADAYVLTRTGLLEQPLSYVDGESITFITANANTGASTVNKSSLGVKKILDLAGNDIEANSIQNGGITEMVYDAAADSAAGAFIMKYGTSGQWNVSKSSGWLKFPNGLILQWGGVTLSGTPTLFNYPIAFPNQSLLVIGSPRTTITAITAFDVASLTQFQAFASTATPGVLFFAIGY